MNARHTLQAYMATLTALLVIVGLAVFGHVAEHIARIIDIVAAGLVGILGTFRPRTPEAAAPPPAPPPPEPLP